MLKEMEDVVIYLRRRHHIRTLTRVAFFSWNYLLVTEQVHGFFCVVRVATI